MAVRVAIKEKVMQCLNELHPNPNNGTLNSIMEFNIDGFLDEAGKRVALSAPLSALGGGVDSDTIALTALADGSGRIKLPADFLRLIRFRMTGWHRPVTGNEVIKEDSPIYALQFNKLTRGGNAKPVVAIVKGNRTLEYYSVKDGDEHKIDEFSYFPYDSLDEEFPISLFEPTAWMTTALLFDVMQEGANAEMARNKCNELLQML